MIDEVIADGEALGMQNDLGVISQGCQKLGIALAIIRLDQMGSRCDGFHLLLRNCPTSRNAFLTAVSSS